VKVNNTEDAVNVFDRICYEKGAVFVHQLGQYVGRKILKASCKLYFTKFAFKNTVFPDFINCLVEAAQEDQEMKNIDI
jgi:aminopeptidase N